MQSLRFDFDVVSDTEPSPRDARGPAPFKLAFRPTLPKLVLRPARSTHDNKSPDQAAVANAPHSRHKSA